MHISTNLTYLRRVFIMPCQLPIIGNSPERRNNIIVSPFRRTPFSAIFRKLRLHTAMIVNAFQAFPLSAHKKCPEDVHIGSMSRCHRRDNPVRGCITNAIAHVYMQRQRRRKQLIAMVSTDIYPLRGCFYKN